MDSSGRRIGLTADLFDTAGRPVFGTANLLHVLMSATCNRVDRRTSKRRPPGLQQPATPGERFLLLLIQREPPVMKLIG